MALPNCAAQKSQGRQGARALPAGGCERGELWRRFPRAPHDAKQTLRAVARRVGRLAQRPLHPELGAREAQVVLHPRYRGGGVLGHVREAGVHLAPAEAARNGREREARVADDLVKVGRIVAGTEAPTIGANIDMRRKGIARRKRDADLGRELRP